MTDKELRKLSRVDLLQILADVTKESEGRAGELADLRRQMEENDELARTERAGEAERMRRMLESVEQQVRDGFSFARARAGEDAACLRELLDLAGRESPGAAAELEAVRLRLAETESRLAETKGQLSETENRLAGTESRLAGTKGQLSETEQKLAEAEQKLAKRSILLEKAGSVAEAAVEISGVLEAAQAAADMFLENARRIHGEEAARQYREMQERMREMERRTRAKCLLMLREARDAADSRDTDNLQKWKGESDNG